MKKEVIKKFDKKYYLLGINQENEKVWIEEPTFDCGWYWGIMYVKVFNSNYTDIVSHTHFDTLFFKRKEQFYEYCNVFFKEMTFSRDEMWTLFEIVKSLYILKEYSDFLHIKGSHITFNPCKNLIANDKEYGRINAVLIPSLLEKLYELLSE